MSYALDSYIVERAPASERAGFIRRTYGHLAGAILAFIAIEFVVFNFLLPDLASRIKFISSLQSAGMIVLLLAFVGIGWLASYWAQSNSSRAVQYMGLGLYVVLEAFIFIPILCFAIWKTQLNGGTSIIGTAGILTLAIFGGLTMTAFTTRKDFSFLGPIVNIAIFIAIALIIAGVIFGFHLGLFFSFAMVAVASAAILYDTSNIIHRYRTDQHVAAALALFASVALLFYYILRILIEVQGRRN